MTDLQPVIEHMLKRGLKLEQEAVQLASASPPGRGAQPAPV
jgi:hypothetical protein